MWLRMLNGPSKFVKILSNCKWHLLKWRVSLASHMTLSGTQSFPILLHFRASEVSSIDNEYGHTVNDLLKATERQSDEEFTGNVCSEIRETLAKIKQLDEWTARGGCWRFWFCRRNQEKVKNWWRETQEKEKGAWKNSGIDRQRNGWNLLDQCNDRVRRTKTIHTFTIWCNLL